MMMNKPRYKIGDRFSVMDTVNCEIVQVIEGTEGIVYIFQLFDNPIFKSVLTEKELDNVLVNQKSA